MSPDEEFVSPRIGSINEPPGSNVLGRTLPDGIGPAAPPVLTSLDPTEATIGGDDLTLVCAGSNFLPTSVITFNGGDEPTVFVSTAEVTTIVKPSTAEVPGSYPVTVKHAGGESSPLEFTFHPPEEGDDPDEIEDEIEQQTEEGTVTSRRPPPRRRK